MKNYETGLPKQTRFTKSRQGEARQNARKSAALRTSKPWACPLGSGPCAIGGDGVHSAPPAQDGVNLISPPVARRTAASDGVEPGHTQSQPGVAEMVRMLLSFQRPPHLFGEVAPLALCAFGHPVVVRTEADW